MSSYITCTRIEPRLAAEDEKWIEREKKKTVRLNMKIAFFKVALPCISEKCIRLLNKPSA